jgi:hypothetical protein
MEYQLSFSRMKVLRAARSSRNEVDRGKNGICDPTRSPAMKATVRGGSMSLPQWGAATLT